MRFLFFTGAALLYLASFASALDLNVDDEASLKSASSRYAYGLMSQYNTNTTSTPKQEIGVFPKPHYWWFSGAVWGGLVEYTAFTKDESYVKTVQQALAANYGPHNDIVLDWRRDQEGNDDQAFWALALMSALEYSFPEPETAPASYLQVAVNAYNTMVSRWDLGTCGGGLRWQIYPENAYGWNYKNTISNGAVFALGARLARYTGNQTYVDWSVRIYDWTKQVGLIGDNFEVYDGTDVKTNCASITDKTEWSYNNAMFLHGSTFMYDVTKDETWKARVHGFLDHAGATFFNHPEAENVMVDVCEPTSKCNLDQRSFKAYVARWLAKTAILVPSTKDTITTYLRASAAAAGKACPAGDGLTCGAVWYTGTSDGVTGLGQQLSALEVTQALLTLKQGTIPSTNGGTIPGPNPLSSSASTISSTLVTSSASNPKPSSAPPPVLDSKTVAARSTSSSITAETPAVPGTVSLSSTVAASLAGGGFGELPSPFATSSTYCATGTAVVPPTLSVAQPCSSTCLTSTTTTVIVSALSTWPGALTSSASIPANATATGSVPPVSAPAGSTTVLPVARPANISVASLPPNNASSTSIPVTFPGTAPGIPVARSTLFAAAALVALAGIL